jgi:hypothetical protein
LNTHRAFANLSATSHRTYMKVRKLEQFSSCLQSEAL